MCSCPGPTHIQTSIILLIVRFVGPCLCQRWMGFLHGCLPYAEGGFSSLCSFLRQQWEAFASLVTHNLSLLTWCNLDFNQIDQSQGVRVEVNISLTKVTKACTFYFKKIKRMRTQWLVRRANPSGNLNSFIRYGMNIFGLFQKKANLLSLSLSVADTGNKKLDLVTVP